jgi:fructosamine-3-kinase
MWAEIEERIRKTSGNAFTIEHKQSVGGGCINDAWKVSGTGSTWFVKTNSASGLAMFEAEAKGLGEMADTKTIRVPVPLCTGVAGNTAFLVMEYLPMGGRGSVEVLGEQLAAMHKVTRARFGWDIDNTIGSTLQVNTLEDDWVRFWNRHRLGLQLDLAARKGIGAGAVRKGEALMERVHVLFADYAPEASLLHGDLWGGNASFDDQGNPVIFDPAVYYGDRETDLAMTELFGGFGGRFFSAYHAVNPVDPGYSTRKTLYNLYHILNHYNLFGGGYGSQAEGMMDRLLSELR